ncbi:MAG TPA: alpha/beta fold hydrolase, partial [Candidatus Acidoferrum sp.]|nr:alpha/beta fold hydrolase [Candidatus Acidoferrum sp.]
MIKNAEFFFEGNRTGVLLIHGLTGTPNEMRLLGKGLHNAGFTVYGMQLAGHCGDVDDLLRTGWKDWYHSVELAVARLRQSTDRIFIAGLSMGAVLSLKYAADNPAHVAGVGVYGVTFAYDGWCIPFYARKLGFLLNWLPVRLFGKRVFVEQPPYGLKDERLRAIISQSMLGGDSVAAGLAG